MARWTIKWDGDDDHSPLWLRVLRILAWIVTVLALVALTLWGVLPR